MVNMKVYGMFLCHRVSDTAAEPRMICPMCCILLISLPNVCVFEVQQTLRFHFDTTHRSKKIGFAVFCPQSFPIACKKKTHITFGFDDDACVEQASLVEYRQPTWRRYGTW